MRLDRFITLNLVHPLRQAFTAPKRSDGGSPLDRFLPILMYHSISDDPEPGVRPYYRVCTSPQRFREQMQWLKDNSYRGVTLSDGLAWLNSPHASTPAPDADSHSARKPGAEGQREVNAVSPFNSELAARCSISNVQSRNSQLSTKIVALTFDDGFRDFYTTAWPILRQHGFAATVFLPTAFIGETRRRFSPRNSSRLSTFNSQPSTALECLTWNEIQDLHRAGIEFGSHTVNHPQLTDLSRKEIEHELRASKSELEQQLGGSITSFAYPFAFPQNDRRFKESFRSLLSEAGYTCCATTAIGRVKLGDDPYALKRLPVNSLDDPAFFLAKLKGGYDWLAHGQAAVKTLKRLKSPRWVSAN